jgi:hypothetical protein
MLKKGSRTAGIALIIFSIFVIGVSAYVYQQAQMTLTQTIVEIATLTVQNSALGTINEGETKSYTKAAVATLGDAIILTTTTQPVYLLLDSDVDSLSGSYSDYTIVVKFIQVQGATYSVGDTAATITLAAPDPAAITLDAIGEWKFDLEVTTTASSVDADTPTTATIDVYAQSTP